MKPEPSNDAIRAEAARWLIRRDRGLSSAESIEYELWLAADERHAAATRRSTGVWSLLDRIPETAAAPVLAAATRRRSFWRRTVLATSLATAAALAVFLLPAGRAPLPSAPAGLLLPPAAIVSTPAPAPRQLTLSDGSIVQINTGGEILEQFTAFERRVLLRHGEAHFNVTKNAERPFVVRAGNLDVRAVGTAFNVNLRSADVEVLVTEGVVKLDPSTHSLSANAPATPIPLLNPGQRATIPLSPGSAFVVTAIDHTEISRTLAWQEPLLRLRGATLAEVALEFEQRTGRRVVLADPSLAELRLGGRFRADDVEGFANVLATTLDLAVERTADGTIVLRKKKTDSR